MCLKLENAVFIRAGDQRLNNTARHRLRLVALHHQRCYPDRSVDAAPRLLIYIEDDKEVTREERCGDNARCPRVPHRLVTFRLECAKGLVVQLPLSTPFGEGQGIYCVPALPRLEKSRSPLYIRKSTNHGNTEPQSILIII